MKKLLLYTAFLSILLYSCGRDSLNKSPVIGILGAFGDEVKLLEDSLRSKSTISIEGIKFTEGWLQGKHVVIAYTGMGKVNAAMTTSLLISGFHPKSVLFTGIAGGISSDVKPGDIIVGERMVQHDLNYVYDDSLVSFPVQNPVNDSTDPLYFKADKRLLQLTQSVLSGIQLQKVNLGNIAVQPAIYFGTIATGDAFVASERVKKQLIHRFHADAVEMEGAAVAQVCYQLSVPFIVIRSISDSADHNANLDVDKFLHIAAVNASTLILHLLAAM